MKYGFLFLAILCTFLLIANYIAWAQTKTQEHMVTERNKMLLMILTASLAWTFYAIAV